MSKDLLLREIDKRLDGTVNPHTFQSCAQALLTEIYPTLVPMEGGDDGGFDGAVVTSEGRFPLICTTSKSGPLENFRYNIRRALETSDGPRQAIIATPRSVSNRKKRNLERVARTDYAVKIVAIYDKPFFRDRLYRDSHWRKELLGVTGRPPALSALPPRSRSERPPLIGRDEDLRWLLDTDGDLLLVGQPGVGKTYLHEKLVEQEKALFVVDFDSERLANALRAQKPEIVIVDDAHATMESLEGLIWLRRAVDADFGIHANCWPNAAKALKEILQLPDSKVRELRQLTRDQMLELIEALGIKRTNRLKQLLIEAADGRPGLAAVLVSSLKSGDFDQVWSGETVAQSLLNSRWLPAASEAKTILACLSFGGDYGLTLEEVAAFLQVPEVRVRDTVTNLAAGGVIEDVPEFDGGSGFRMAVQPAILRGLLMRDVYYHCPAPLDPAPIISALRTDPARRGELAHTLMFARQRGANVSRELIAEIASDCYQDDVWRHFGYVDRAAAEFILQRYPERVLAAAPGLLDFAPRQTLAKLLSIAANGKEKQAAGAVRDWLEGEEPGSDVTLPRRRHLLAVLKRLCGHEGSEFAVTHAWALALLIKPDIDKTDLLPGSGSRLAFYRGIRSMPQLERIAEIWPEVMALLCDSSPVPVSIRKAVESWCLSQRVAIAGQSEQQEFMQKVGRRMLADITELPDCPRPVRSWAHRVARWAKLDLTVKIDRTFHRLFHGYTGFACNERNRRRHEGILRSLAERYGKQAPEAALGDLSAMEVEARELGPSESGLRYIHFYPHIAAVVEDPVAWLREGIERRIPPQALRGFMTRALSSAAEIVYPLLESLLDSQEYNQLAWQVVLSMEAPPGSLLKKTLSMFGSEAPLEHAEILYCNPPESTLRKLLTHPAKVIRVHAALAEWEIRNRGQARDSLYPEWRNAILEAWNECDYLLVAIFQSDHTLAFDWARRKLAEARANPRKIWLFGLDRLFADIVQPMDGDARWELLDQFTPETHEERIVRLLIADDAELYRRWVRKHHSRGERGTFMALSPLNRQFDSAWDTLTKVAFDEGVAPEEMAYGLMPEYTRIMDEGSWSDHFRSRLSAFKRLASHEDERLRIVGQVWSNRVRNELARTEKREWRREVRGLHA